MKGKLFIAILIASVSTMSSCNDFVELDTAKTRIVSSKVFESDAGARASVSGILSQMMIVSSFASGSTNSITLVCGLSSDEFLNHSSSQILVTLYNNSLNPINNGAVTNNWNDMYLVIYEANAILEGCQKSTALTSTVRDQVIGEAKFLRAFTYFYLINLFGDVPLVMGTDYRVNKSLSRTPVAQVYDQIENDLIDAQKLLLEDYSMSLDEKVEPNKWAATALLARVYLYQKNWTKAESQATAIISSQLFSLPEPNSAFLANSEEAIWQLMPVFPGSNTNEAQQLIFTGTPTRVSLSPAVTNNFESGDARRSSWVKTVTSSGKTYAHVFKYKVRLQGQPLTEYYTVFRLAEQYLIRAEARAMQNNLVGAIDDVNILRSRAELPPIDATGMNQNAVLGAIEKERKAELFAEWGHRWFDLKRSGNIDAVLGPIKPDWQSKDALFPIPQAEIIANPNIVQNPQ